MSEKTSYLTFIENAGRNQRRRLIAKYRCVCGNEVIRSIDAVSSFNTKSCGCKRYEKLIERNTKHGLVTHPLFPIWQGIRKRCYDIKNSSYPDYGGRGITVCDEWNFDFLPFYNWAISNEWQQGIEIDRKKNDGNYEPFNCRFVTSKVNANNKRNNIVITIEGETKTAAEWGEKVGIRGATIRKRIKDGWDDRLAVTTPLQQHTKKSIHGDFVFKNLN